MRWDGRGALAVAVSVVVGTGQAWPGVVIEQVARGGGGSQQQRVLLDTNRIKTLLLDSDGRPVTAFILDLNIESIIHADYAGGQYGTGTVQEYMQLMQWLRQKAWEQLPAQLRDAAPQSRDCREFRIAVRRAGQPATIAGYPALRYDVLVDGALHSEAWVARGIPGGRELDARKFAQFVGVMARLGTCGPEHVHQWFFAADPGAKAFDEGFPVRITGQSGSGWTLEVVKTETRAISRAEFEPPADLARRTFREMIKR